ncbi:nucleotidyltransferase [Paenibacillus yanchengensis]|uniref:tRNA(Met) cytidine acetate ligase n=1 Tax=Paenibacillus yanchengensis TaxID=2035833 RepID=A0ABW4YMF4_9BACL
MRTVGLIVEYNPFHHGHLHHLQQAQQISGAEAVVAVMSGNFLQRGEPAIVDKWARTEMALAAGCDLVIELPVAYATQAAEWFAYGAISLLEATGVVDSFCFGTESGELAPLLAASELLSDEPSSFKQSLKQLLQTGQNYPAAYSEALRQHLHTIYGNTYSAFDFAQPNHTLGLHYLIAQRRINATMQPFTIARQKAQFHDNTLSDTSIASATAIRQQLLDLSTSALDSATSSNASLLTERLQSIAPYIPTTSLNILQQQFQLNAAPVTWEQCYPALLQRLMLIDKTELSTIHEWTEGLESRLFNIITTSTPASFTQLLQSLKTKRYTQTKLQRALLAVLLQHYKHDFTRENLQSGIRYIRVLGFSQKGRQLLKKMRVHAKLPVLQNTIVEQPSSYLTLDIQASNLYELLKSNTIADKKFYRDYKQKPVMLLT